MVTSHGPWLARLAGISVLAAACAWLWGFTVDDALITARVAKHVALGLGYRFNPHGPVVDAVTPLGFVYLLAPAASRGALAALVFAKWLGACSVLGACWCLARRVLAAASLGYALALLSCLAACSPFAAWAVSGMETGVVTALAIGALGRAGWADAAAALAAGLRPELAPWCVTMRVGLRIAQGETLGRAARSGAISLAAVALVGVIRTLAFGRAAPLAVFAKPSDLEHGFRYAVFGFVQSGLPLLCLAPFSLRRASPIAKAVAVGGVVHFLALCLAGGDWMTLYRLWVPVLPSFVLGAAEQSRSAKAWSNWGRVAVAFAMSVYLAVAVGPAARGVGADRRTLIEAARAPLASSRVVATLDVGWVSAVADFDVVDLAGVTDENIAMLPGGHTSKRISDAVLRGRDVDTLVLLRDRGAPEFAREVERRVALLPSAETFRVVAQLPLGSTGSEYVVLRR